MSFLHATPESYTPVSENSYYAGLSQTRKLETARRVASERYTKLLQEVSALEVKMGINRRWDVFDTQYIETAKYIAQRKYIRALKNLQHLVVLQLFELHKLNLSRTGGFVSILFFACSHMIYRLQDEDSYSEVPAKSVQSNSKRRQGV